MHKKKPNPLLSAKQKELKKAIKNSLFCLEIDLGKVLTKVDLKEWIEHVKRTVKNYEDVYYRTKDE